MGDVPGGRWGPEGKPCPECGTRFPNKERLREHRREAHPATCPVCGKAFATAEGVALHAAAAHGGPSTG